MYLFIKECRMYERAKVEIGFNNPFKQFFIGYCQNEFEFNIHLWIISIYYTKKLRYIWNKKFWIYK